MCTIIVGLVGLVIVSSIGFWMYGKEKAYEERCKKSGHRPASVFL